MLRENLRSFTSLARTARLLQFGTRLALVSVTENRDPKKGVYVMNRKALPMLATLIVLIGIIASQAEAQPKQIKVNVGGQSKAEQTQEPELVGAR